MCIICVTKENVRSPWLYFETGAIAGKGDGVRVCPYLLGIGPNMLSDGPLGKYQCTAATKEETLSLIGSLNGALDETKRHDKGLLEGNFETRWPEFEAELERILATDTTEAEDFVATDADEVAGYKLSSEARTLLVEASQDKHGRIMYTRTGHGVAVRTNGHDLVEPGNPRSAAMWKQAIDDLLSYHLLEPRGNTGEGFDLTGRGYKVADLLKQ